MKVLIKGAGDIASGIATRLYECGYMVTMTDLENPTAIRQTVAFSSAIKQGVFTLEGIKAVKCTDKVDIEKALQAGHIAVLADKEAKILQEMEFDVVVDAILAKRNISTKINDAKTVIGVGPGFTAKKDCDYCIETKRGHYLGKVIDNGSPIANTGKPGNIAGYTKERIIRAVADGTFKPLAKISDIVKKGDIVAKVDDKIITANIDGVIRGMLTQGIKVTKGFKCGDIDPRANIDYCFSVSDKARAVGGGVLEAILRKENIK